MTPTSDDRVQNAAGRHPAPVISLSGLGAAQGRRRGHASTAGDRRCVVTVGAKPEAQKFLPHRSGDGDEE